LLKYELSNNQGVIKIQRNFAVIGKKGSIIQTLSIISKLLLSALLAGSFSTVAGAVTDSDGDGISDSVELTHGLNPDRRYDVWRDLDRDHLPLIVELQEGLDTTVADNDVFNNKRLLIIQAVADMQSRFASKAQIKRLLKANITPVELYQTLLDGHVLARMSFIGRVYQGLLLRKPDLDGARYYHHQLSSGMSQETMIGQFVHSDEFAGLYGELSNRDFVDQIYLNLYECSPPSQESALIAQRLNENSLTRTKVMSTLLMDGTMFAELNLYANFVDVLTLLLTDQLPTADEQHGYLQSMKVLSLQKQNITRGVLTPLLMSDEFRQSRMADISAAKADTDGDGLTDGEEFVYGFDVNVKDNDVLGNDRLFVRQMLLDIGAEKATIEALNAGLVAMKQAGGRVDWVKLLLAKNPEATAKLFNALYKRKASKAELAQQGDIGQLVEKVLESSEYQQRFY
jgi:hypothetical protein